MQCVICGRESGSYRGVPVCMTAYEGGALRLYPKNRKGVEKEGVTC